MKIRKSDTFDNHNNHIEKVIQCIATVEWRVTGVAFL